MRRQPRKEVDWLAELELDSDLAAVVRRLRLALPLLAPAPAFSQSLERQLLWQARLFAGARPQSRFSIQRLLAGARPQSWRSIQRPLLLGAAALSVVGAAFYLWQNRSLHHSLVWTQRRL